MSWHVFLTSLLNVASSVTPLDIVQNAGISYIDVLDLMLVTVHDDWRLRLRWQC